MLLVHLINRVVREERMTGRWDEGRGGGGGGGGGTGRCGGDGETLLHSCGCSQFSPSLRTKESPEPHQR